MSHTPGPWVAMPHKGWEPADDGHVYGPKRFQVRGPDDAGPTAYSVCCSARKDNAFLIAAAPELLSALKRCVQWLSDLGNDISEKAELLSAIDAIAKAEGRAE